MSVTTILVNYTTIFCHCSLYIYFKNVQNAKFFFPLHSDTNSDVSFKSFQNESYPEFLVETNRTIIVLAN